MKSIRKKHSAAFKARVALAAVKNDKTIGDLSAQFDVHPTQIANWKKRLLENSADVFETNANKTKVATADLKALHAKIGEQALEIDFLEQGLGSLGLLSSKR